MTAAAPTTPPASTSTHACAALLRPDPAQRPRLAQISDNLAARIAEAQANHWLGEAEGLKVSLAGARHKLAQMDQITARRTTAVSLGIPAFPDTASRTATTWGPPTASPHQPPP